MNPISHDRLVAAFGDPTPYIRADGSVSNAWTDSILAAFQLPAPLPLSWKPEVAIEVVRCHRLVLPFMREAFRECFMNREAWASINDYGGCYCWRPMRKANVLSHHCWAIAVDIDANDNPFGKAPKMHPAVVDVFKAHGFCWGGDWRVRKDGMHFEFADLDLLSSA